MQSRKIYYSKQLLGDKLKNTILKIKIKKEITFVQFHSIAISRLNRIFFYNIITDIYLFYLYLLFSSDRICVYFN